MKDSKKVKKKKKTWKWKAKWKDVQLSIDSLNQWCNAQWVHTSVGVVVRGFPPLRSSRQSDSWWRNLSTEGAWRCAWCTGCSRSCSCCTDVLVSLKEDEVLVVKGRWGNQGWDMKHTRWLNSFQAHKDDNAVLEPSALCVRSALVNKLYCTDVYCEWVSCLQPRSTLHLFRSDTSVNKVAGETEKDKRWTFLKGKFKSAQIVCKNSEHIWSTKTQNKNITDKRHLKKKKRERDRNRQKENNGPKTLFHFRLIFVVQIPFFESSKECIICLGVVSVSKVNGW